MFLSELYAADAADAVLLAEYPSSNSDETRFRNRKRYIIHDPYPPPPRALLKILGPHHLMCGWGRRVPVTSEIAPPAALTEHWEAVLEPDAKPDWQLFNKANRHITLFPHESLSVESQVIDPEANYAIHSKAVIERIECPQAAVLPKVQPPCVVKLSHGYAGLQNFFVRDAADAESVQSKLRQHWPGAEVVVNSIIEHITGDFGVQFYLGKDGSITGLGLTQQHFDEQGRWCGGSFSADQQPMLFEEFAEFVQQTGSFLHTTGYFGLVGIDILQDASGGQYLVDVNPRLTGISPFLVASRILRKRGLTNGIYRASCCYPGSLTELIAGADERRDAQVLVLSAFENLEAGNTVCHLSVSSDSMSHCATVFAELCPQP